MDLGSRERGAEWYENSGGRHTREVDFIGKRKISHEEKLWKQKVDQRNEKEMKGFKALATFLCAAKRLRE